MFSSGLALQNTPPGRQPSYSRDPHRTAAPALRFVLFDANTLKHSGNSISDLRNRRQKVAAEIWCYSFRLIAHRSLAVAPQCDLAWTEPLRQGFILLVPKKSSSGDNNRSQAVLVDLNPGGTSIQIDSRSSGTQFFLQPVRLRNISEASGRTRYLPGL